MIPGLIEGLLAGSVEHVSAERDRNRQEEDRTLEQRRGYLDTLMKGMMDGAVNPQFFARAWADAHSSMTPGSQRKPKGGKAGFLGQTEMPMMPFFEALMNGEIPITTPQGESPMPTQGTSAQAPPPAVPLSGEIGTPMTAPPIPEPPKGPKLPGQGEMRGAAADLAGEVTTSGPQGLLFSPEERAGREARGTVAGMRAKHSALTDLLGPVDAQRALMASLGANQSTALRYGDDFLAPDGTIGKAAIEPTTQQYVLTQPVVLANGQQIPAGTSLPPGWQPYQRPIVSYDQHGTAFYTSPGNLGATSAPGRGRATPAYGFPFAADDPNSSTGVTFYTPNRFSGTATPTRTQGQGQPLAAPPRTEPVDLDVDAADAQQRLELLQQELEQTLTPEALTNPNAFMDARARELWGVGLEELQRAAGQAPRRPRRGAPGGGGAGRPQMRVNPSPQPGASHVSPDAAVDAYLQSPKGKAYVTQYGGDAERVRDALLNNQTLLAQIMAAFARGSQ